MKKIVLSTMLIVFLCVSGNSVMAQDIKAYSTLADSVATDSVATDYVAADTSAVDSTSKAATTPNSDSDEASGDKTAKEPGFSEVIKEKLIEGGVWFMGIVLLCLILGLTVAIERIITLNLASTNIKKFLNKVKDALSFAGVSGVKKLCTVTPGPLATVLSQGLLRKEDGIDGVEKAIESYGSAEVSRLEKGMSWLSLFIALAPMFGFMGTVIGMIDAFDKIEGSAEINISEVAGGIKVALLTTVAGLIVAVILQIFYNYLVSKIDDITSQLEDGSNAFVSMLATDKDKLKE